MVLLERIELSSQPYQDFALAVELQKYGSPIEDRTRNSSVKGWLVIHLPHRTIFYGGLRENRTLDYCLTSNRDNHFTIRPFTTNKKRVKNTRCALNPLGVMKISKEITLGTPNYYDFYNHYHRSVHSTLYSQ